MTSRRACAWPALICGALMPSLHACAADNASAYPARPVRWIVPFPPAGSIDLVGRVVGQKLYEAWGQQVVIDNRSGGGGRLGTQAATTAAADGYTQLFTLNTSFTIDRSLFKNLPYDPDKALTPITIVASTSQLLVTNPSFPVKNVRKLIAQALEMGLIEPQEKAAWLVERYGFDINFASVAPADVVAVDAIRRGMHRKSHYNYMAGHSG